ncbi:MAG: S-methyl-5-thioribose-1-phosphate isomerase [Gemmatimonadaceae bacterium]
MLPIPVVAWSPSGRSITILDQSALPECEVSIELVTLDDVINAIRALKVRGAPAIGVAAAMGLVTSLENSSGRNTAVARSQLKHSAAQLIGARPTAVNLEWAVRRVVASAIHSADADFFRTIRAEAQAIHDEDVVMCRRIGDAGLPLINDGARILTHCNAGALATAGIGTALAPLYRAHETGKRIQVFVDETRPLRQGARLTAWELSRAGISVTLLPDSAAASLLREETVDFVIVGADRIAANGDVANKIGTYPLALAAREHGVPFYVAAPFSTLDADTESGEMIPIEQRDAVELHPMPANVGVYNPAFDVTPAALVSAYITDRGILVSPDNRDGLPAMIRSKARAFSVDEFID